MTKSERFCLCCGNRLVSDSKRCIISRCGTRLCVDCSAATNLNRDVIVYGSNADQPCPVGVGRVVDRHARRIGVRLRSDRDAI
jgi:hypothetical protein